LELIIGSNHLTFLKNCKISLLRILENNIKKLKFDDHFILTDNIYIHLLLFRQTFQFRESVLRELINKLYDVKTNRQSFFKLLSETIEEMIDQIVKSNADDQFKPLFITQRKAISTSNKSTIELKIKSLKNLLDMILKYKLSILKTKRTQLVYFFQKDLLSILNSSHDILLYNDEHFNDYLLTIFGLLNGYILDKSYVDIIIDGILTLVYRSIIAFQKSLISVRRGNCDSCNICSAPVICSIDVLKLNERLDIEVSCSSCRKLSDKYNGFKCGHIVCTTCVNCSIKCDVITSYRTENIKYSEYFLCPCCEKLTYYVRYPIDASVHLTNCVICFELKQIKGFLRCGHTNICNECVLKTLIECQTDITSR
jgi:hypothetical protein